MQAVRAVRRADRVSIVAGPRAQSAVDTALAQGLPLWNQPATPPPAMPPDLTAVDDEDLMILYSLLTAWADYTSTQVSCAQVDERAAEKSLSHSENLLMLAHGDKGDRVTFARAQVAADPHVIALKEEVEKWHAYRKIVESLLGNIERDAALVSRELTRRTAAKGRASTNRWTT